MPWNTSERELKDLVSSPYSPEYDIVRIADPFLHIRLLILLCVLGEGDAETSDYMNDILAHISLCLQVASLFYIKCMKAMLVPTGKDALVEALQAL